MTVWSRGKTLRALTMIAPVLFGVAVLQAETLERVSSSVTRVASERATQGITPQEFLTQQRELQEWIISQVPLGAERASVSISISQQDRKDLADSQADRTQSPMRVGVVKAITPAITFTNAKKSVRRDAVSARNGIQKKMNDGKSVWVMTVESPGAVAVRVHFENVLIPQGSELFFFNDRGEAYGPYVGTGPNGTGEFWSNSVIGSKGTVMLRGANLNHASLSITEVGHVATDFPKIAQQGTQGSVASFCSFNASCIENNSCTSNPAVNDAENAVAKMRWISGAFINICSGGLLADTDAGSQIPYFLTANHCMSKNGDAANLEAYFQYTVSCGTSVCAGSFDPAPSPSTLGATVTASNRRGDFTLLTLSQTPPAGSTFLGWNNTPISGSNGADLHRVSHPSGAPQAYSRHSVDPSSPECRGWPRGERIYSKDITGATEGGSSGSPVVNAAGEVVGQLSGCCGFACGEECNTVDNWTVDGALAFYWDSVAPFLDPQGGGGGCTSDSECDDGQWCNGSETCASGSCQSGSDPCPGQGCDEATDTCVSCDGGQVGDSCVDDTDCCSNKCKGRSGNKTCK